MLHAKITLPILNAPWRSPFPCLIFRQATSTEASKIESEMTMKIISLALWLPVESDFFMRCGFVHGPIIEKKTGLPRHEAASMRSGRPEPGHFPVQAARASEAASEFHSGSADWSCAGSSAAAAKRIFQS